jgi:hypothetical protein
MRRRRRAKKGQSIRYSIAVSKGHLYLVQLAAGSRSAELNRKGRLEVWLSDQLGLISELAVN